AGALRVWPALPADSPKAPASTRVRGPSRVPGHAATAATPASPVRRHGHADRHLPVLRGVLDVGAEGPGVEPDLAVDPLGQRGSQLGDVHARLLAGRCRGPACRRATVAARVQLPCAPRTGRSLPTGPVSNRVARSACP